MAIQNPQLQGRSALPTAIVEAAGSFASLTAAHAATDSMKWLSYTSNPTEDRQPRRDVRPSRDDFSMMVRSRANEWSNRQNFLPRLLAVPPDNNPFLQGIYGTQTIGGASVTYSYARVPPAIAWIVTGGEPTMVAQEKMVGALVEQRVITLSQGEEPIQEFSGIASRCVRVSGTAIVASGVASATQTVGTNEAYNFEVGSIVDVVTVAGGTNLRIVAIPAHNQVTLSASVTTLGAEVIRPSTLWSEITPTNQGGEVIASWNGSASIAGATTYGITGATITMKQNWLEKRIQFDQHFVDAGLGFREITGTFTFNSTDRDLHLMGLANQNPASGVTTINPVAVVFTLGDSTNGQCVITMPQVVLMKSPNSVPAEGNATFQLAFKALSTRTAGVPNSDAISEVWS